MDHGSILYFAFLVAILVALVYACAIVSFFWNLSKRIAVKNVDAKSSGVSISVLIPFRNEEAKLRQVINSILSQSKLPDELILIDDHSTDRSYEMAQEFAKAHPFIRVLKNAGLGKKQAIETGIAVAQSEYVAMTDADCCVPETWLYQMSKILTRKKPFLLIMPVTTKRTRTFNGNFQELDFLSLIASTFGAGSRPFLCNGANLLVKRDVFLQLDPYNDNRFVNSGDDIFLLQAIQKNYPDKVSLEIDENLWVSTEVKPDWKGFFEQRLRWGGKSVFYTDKRPILIALLVFVYNFILLLAGLLLCFDLVSVEQWAILFLIKFTVDSALLIKACIFFRKSYLIPLILPASLLYVLYVPVIAVIGVLKNSFKRK